MAAASGGGPPGVLQVVSEPGARPLGALCSTLPSCSLCPGISVECHDLGWLSVTCRICDPRFCDFLPQAVVLLLQRSIGSTVRRPATVHAIALGNRSLGASLLCTLSWRMNRCVCPSRQQACLCVRGLPEGGRRVSWVLETGKGGKDKT